MSYEGIFINFGILVFGFRAWEVNQTKCSEIIAIAYSLCLSHMIKPCVLIREIFQEIQGFKLNSYRMKLIKVLILF